MVGYLFTLLELCERGRKKKKKEKKKRDIISLLQNFQKKKNYAIVKGDDRIKEKNGIQHHRCDRRVSKQLCIS